MDSFETPKKQNEFRNTLVLLSLLAGLVGGVIGQAFVTPWFQENILRREPFEQERAQIVFDEQSAIISAVEKVNPAVVSIVITKDLPKLDEFFSPFGFYYSEPSGDLERQEIGAGSGFIISADGLIVTNKHVVSDPDAAYTVITQSGDKYSARVTANDPFNDIAVVKIEAANLPVVSLGDSDRLKLGQRVVAIGNALGEFQNTVTSGIVSGIGRDITASGGAESENLFEVIQTDAAINPGNSGGPLADLEGNVIGVNSAVSLEGQLIGFAIPINQVKDVIEDVKQYGRVRRAFLGVRYITVDADIAAEENLAVDYGALIVAGDTASEPGVVPGSPADKAGLRSGDIILEVDGQKVTVENSLSQIMRGHSPGDTVPLRFRRADEVRDVSVTLGEAE
ncbi:MAG: hypothetical protein A2846_00365 [Candidatus Doudnabacteria bacterium RIFCSPHIGHO2_01_FULL_49_9]|uniref:PDZ domain-containing protein n=1 Tax=Candidatus Doudnabacteria bacterium RIFCSPHIGHO2_01_FULL_49_9 TaxID=1817827 RepID=A0A1F5NY31_9BACT|nr:MAG: hypothetical protein A2846_00365 [Candidatus Doudnabacteria bacterium RIFCSPHIGHO2_01_FULL_49_9]